MMVGLVGGTLGILVVALAPNIRSCCSAGAWPSCSSTRCWPPGGGAARPGAGRAARHGRRGPRRLPAARVGGRHVPGQGVHRQRAGDVPGAVRHRRLFMVLFALYLDDRRLAAADRPPGRCASSGHVLRRPAPAPGLRVGVRQPVPVRPRLRLPGHLPGVLPARPARQPEADVPQQIFLGTLVQSVVVVAASLVGGRLSDRTGRRKVFVRRRGRLRRGPVRHRGRQRLRRLPGRDGHRRPRVRPVHGRRPRARRRRPARPGHRRQGPGRAEHRRRPAVRDRAGDRAAGPRGRRGSYNVLYAVAGVWRPRGRPSCR